jgi:structure-specific recognition protein 1
MATDKKGKVSLNIRRRNKPKNASSNDASKLKELNSAFESSKNKNKMNSKNENPAKKEKKEKKAKKDTKEKKPRKLNAYMVFAMEVRESVKKNHPTASITEIAKKIGEKWRAMSDAEKAKYKK